MSERTNQISESPLYCNHANEMPYVCTCDPECYCRVHGNCRNRSPERLSVYGTEQWATSSSSSTSATSSTSAVTKTTAPEPLVKLPVEKSTVSFGKDFKFLTVNDPLE